MKFKNYLNEVLKKKVPVKTTSSSGMNYEIRFKAAGEEYMFVASDAMFTDDWAIHFTTSNVDPSNPWSATGDVGSKAFEVFAGVGESLKKFIKDKDPEYFHFRAEGASRIKLYKKLAKLIERKTKYEHITTTTVAGAKIFYFSK